MTELVGQTLDRYRILRLLGAGGMGSVYRARDLDLGRDVALKVLHEVAADDPIRRERFNREIRTAASLNHPNIVEVHDYGHACGVAYAVMELLEGRDLRSLLRGRGLPLRQALDIGASVASGLGAAHHRGVLHRDIKPENIFVTSAGTVKILDFGLARIFDELGEDSGAADDDRETITAAPSLTSPGTVMGTSGYMSPEQARGQILDARSDIFSLGCVLYELLVGTNPFFRETRADTLSAILNDEPGPVSMVRPELPPALGLIVDRCLQKDPDHRFESARDVAIALQALSESRTGPQVAADEMTPLQRWMRPLVLVAVTAAVVAGGLFAGWPLIERWLGIAPQLPERLRVSVMPFVAEAEDPELLAYAGGLTEIITDDLEVVEAHDAHLDWVVPRSDQTSFSDGTIGGVRRTFTNNVSIVGNIGRNSAELRLELTAVDPSSRRPFGTAEIRDTPGNVQSFQEQPVLRIAEMLGVDLGETTRGQLAAGSTTMTAAFDAWVRGRGLLARASDASSIEDAIALFEHAVAEDPLFAKGYLALARASLAMHESGSEDGWIDRGLDHAARALQLGAREDDVEEVRAALQVAARRPQDAAAVCERILALKPGDAEACLKCGTVFLALGNVEEAEAAFKRSVFLRPDYWPGHDQLAKLYAARGSYEEAAVQFRRVIDCAPDYALAYVKLGAVSFYMEDFEAARQLFERSLEIEPTYYALSHLGSLHFEASRFADATAMYEQAVAMNPTDFWVWGNLAYAYRFSSAPEKAETTFRRAAELAEARHLEDPSDYWAPTACAGYHAMLGNRERGLELIDEVVATEPTDPQLIAAIAETFEDLGERGRALEWVAKAFAVGISRTRFEGRPTLRNLVADERYQALVNEDGNAR